MTSTKAVLLNFDPPFNVNPPDGYLLAYQATSGFWVPVNVPLGINRYVRPTVTYSFTTTTVTGGTVALPQATINVTSTASFPSSGIINVASSAGTQTIIYTGTSGGNQFTGCTGGTGNITAGSGVATLPFTATGSVTSTAITSASNGLSLPQSTINVVSTAGFPSSGIIFVTSSNGVQAVVYTGTSGGTQFTGCSGGSGTLFTNALVSSTLANTPDDFIPTDTTTVPSTTIAVASNGQSLPQSTINVGSTAGFSTFGSIYVTTSGGPQLVTYTGTTSTSFTGCSGGSGSMTTGGQVLAILTVYLPGTLPVGKGFTVADVPGTDATNNVIVSGNGHNIIGSGTFVINTNYGELTVVFNGTNWTRV